MKGLTEKQQDILDFIGEFSHREGMAPTVSEISEHFGIKAATAFAHIRALQRKGYVNRSSKARSLTLMQAEKPRHFSMTLSVPVLGRISAGIPFMAEQHVERRIQIDPRTLPARVSGCRLFALQVTGESMRDMGILDGDLVIAKATDQAEIGDIIVAMVDNETTVKSLYLTDSQWELRPANSEYKSRFVPFEQLNIQGVVVALQRVY